jgi:hypothetical protein
LRVLQIRVGSHGKVSMWDSHFKVYRTASKWWWVEVSDAKNPPRECCSIDNSLINVHAPTVAAILIARGLDIVKVLPIMRVCVSVHETHERERETETETE